MMDGGRSVGESVGGDPAERGRARAPGASRAGRRRLVLAVLAPLAVLAAAEGVVRALVGHVPDPRIVRAAVGPGRTRLEVVSPWSSVETRAEFDQRKGRGVLRLLFLGASTTAGVPYAPRCSYPAMVGERLRAMLPGRDVEVLNLGAATEPTRVSREVAAWVDDADVVVVEAGHNEYLPHNLPSGPLALRGLRRAAQRLELFRVLERGLAGPRLARLGEAGPDTPPAADRPPLFRDDPAPPATIEAWFADDLRATLRAQRARGAALVVVIPPANWIEYGPEESRLPTGADARAVGDELLAIDALVEAVEHDGAGEAARVAAIARCEGLLAAAPGVAAVEHRLAVLLADAGRVDEARVMLERAFDHAVRPHVATPRILRRLREVAEDEGAAVVDAHARFRAASPDGIARHPALVDHCHPSLDGQYLLATAVLDALRGAAEVGPRSAWRDDFDPPLDQTLMRLGVPRDLRFTAPVHSGTADLRFALFSFAPRRYARRAVLRLREEAARPTLDGALAAVAMGVAAILAGDPEEGAAAVRDGLRRGGDRAAELLDGIRATGARAADALASAGFP